MSAPTNFVLMEGLTPVARLAIVRPPASVSVAAREAAGNMSINAGGALSEEGKEQARQLASLLPRDLVRITPSLKREGTSFQVRRVRLYVLDAERSGETAAILKQVWDESGHFGRGVPIELEVSRADRAWVDEVRAATTYTDARVLDVHIVLAATEAYVDVARRLLGGVGAGVQLAPALGALTLVDVVKQPTRGVGVLVHAVASLTLPTCLLWDNRAKADDGAMTAAKVGGQAAAEQGAASAGVH
jgi:broad specificity phosphatase PhoE